MIFLSHNYKDKPVVEQVALKLRAAFGQDKVFYDAWSIQPGERIIDRMSEALGACTHFFFFVSANSLASRMVSLEWQNAMMLASSGKTTFVPVRCDASSMPPILTQSLYIDLYGQGLDAACAQIADVIAGQNTYREPAQPFSNLEWSSTQEDRVTTVTVRAKHFLEPIGRFVLVTPNDAADFELQVPGEPMYNSGFEPEVERVDGQKFKGLSVGLSRGVTPALPAVFRLVQSGTVPVVIEAVLHQNATVNSATVRRAGLSSARFKPFGTGSLG